jgi:hypothetical protein
MYINGSVQPCGKPHTHIYKPFHIQQNILYFTILFYMHFIGGFDRTIYV